MVVDVEARNAITAMVLHLVSAFKMPAKPRRPLDPPGRGGVSVADLPAKLRPAANGGGFARRRAAMQSLAPSPSLEAGGNLLRTLLQQQKVAFPPFLALSSSEQQLIMLLPITMVVSSSKTSSLCPYSTPLVHSCRGMPPQDAWNT